MTPQTAALPLVERIADGLTVLGGAIAVDGRLSWVPRGVSGYEPVNCYLVEDGGNALLVDTGVAIHETQVLSALAARLGDTEELSILLTRAEYECIGNVGKIIATHRLAAIYTGGVANPFDAFDEITHTAWADRVRLGQIPFGERLPLGDSSRIDVLAPPIRTLSTYWAYDKLTKTLFSSDTFGWGISRTPLESRIATPASNSVSEEWVRSNLLAKFNWIGQATKLGLVREHLAQVFELCDVESIAPIHGQILCGEALVAEHHELLDTVLRNLELEASTRATRRSRGPKRTHAKRTEIAAITSNPGRHRDLPRLVAPGIHWLGKCLEGGSVEMRGALHHSHLSVFLLMGDNETLLIDTGVPSGWDVLNEQLTEALAGRQLDWIFPTHPEYPHSGNLANLLEEHPNAVVIGDTRDYHLYYPKIGSRTKTVSAGDTLDLGGLAGEFTNAILRDLPSSLWLYERSQRILFVADGFSYFHREPIDELDDDVPVHKPGECGLYVSELDAELTPEQAVQVISNALSWSRYVEATPLFEEVEDLMRTHPVRMIAPAHGNLIDDIEYALPVMRQAHDDAYRSSR